MGQENKHSKIYQLTDKEFENIIREAKSRGEALRAIGYRSHKTEFSVLLEKRCQELELDISHWRVQATQRTHENTLCKNVTTSSDIVRRIFKKGNYKEYKCELCGKEEEPLQLNYINGDKTDARIENLRWLCHRCSSLNAFAQKTKTIDKNSILAYKIDEQQFSTIIAQADSKQEAARLIGYRSPHENAFKYIFQRCEELGLDTSHWSYCAWQGCEPRIYENTFCQDSTACQDTLRTKFKQGHYKEYKCAMCGNTGFWNGKPLVLRLDHINGDRTNATIANLRWLCPNCDKLTDTFCGRNSKRATREAEPTGNIATDILLSQEATRSETYSSCNASFSNETKRYVECEQEKTPEESRFNEDGLMERELHSDKSLVYQLTDNEFEKLVKNSLTQKEALRKLGYSNCGGEAWRQFTERCNELNIDRSHFKRTPVLKTYTDEEVFCDNSQVSDSAVINHYKKRKNVPYVCAICGMEPAWIGYDFNFDLDHINGDHHDNRIGNLRWLCPNCHSQEESTYCGANVKHNKNMNVANDPNTDSNEPVAPTE